MNSYSIIFMNEEKFNPNESKYVYLMQNSIYNKMNNFKNEIIFLNLNFNKIQLE